MKILLPGRSRSIRQFLLAGTLSHADFLATRHFGALDGVRAIAAIMVVLFHFGGHRTEFLNGWLGVHLFFVISGFLITTLLLREEGLSGRRISLKNFWVRRVFRIFPAYFLVLGVSAAMMYFANQWVLGRGPESIWYFVSFNPEYAPTSMNLTHFWTIGVEQKFYLVWPLVGFVLISPRFVKHTIARLAILAAIGIATIVFPWLVHYAVISLGSLLAITMHSRYGFVFARLLSSRLITMISLALLIVVQLHARVLTTVFSSETPVVFLYGLCAALLLPGILSRTAFTRVLGTAPLRWVGERSYSLYLVQVIAGAIVISLFPMPSFGWLSAALTVLVSVLIADLMYRFVEQPMIAVGRRLTRGGLRVPPETVPAMRVLETASVDDVEPSTDSQSDASTPA